jgi:hypothetical protein
MSRAAEWLLPALVGALVLALAEPMVMVAVSVAPWESVTTRVKVPDPVTVTRALDAPDKMVVPPLAIHAKDASVRLHDAALPLASNVTEPLAVKVAGKATAAMGRSAAFTALRASTMPVPHSPLAGHEHSSVLGSNDGHTGRLPVFGGNAVALDSSRATNCAGVRLPLTARISAAVPDTIGAEKLVPKLEFV